MNSGNLGVKEEDVAFNTCSSYIVLVFFTYNLFKRETMDILTIVNQQKLCVRGVN